MDFVFEQNRPLKRNRFGSVTGTIVDMVPTRIGSRRANGCVIFVTLEDMDGNTVNFTLTPSTYVLDFDTLSVGMTCTFWYAADAPMPLIYPPQYNAVAVAREKSGRNVDLGFYNTSMVNESRTLELHIDASVDIRTTNNQYFQGSPANHTLMVVYGSSTRSIPAQTTPSKIVVFCD